MKKIFIITSSIRKQRIGGDVTNFIESKLETNHLLKTIDLKDWELPYLNQGMPAAEKQDYSTAGANNWAKLISEADAFIFVTPEYNASIPAQLKTNLDVIYDEWLEKPAMIVSYSGSKAGGASAASHLQDILVRLKMKVIDPVSLSGWASEFQDDDDYTQLLKSAFSELEQSLAT